MTDPFIKKVKTITQKNISNEKFGVSELASELGLSRSQVLRKIKSITGKSANRFIRDIRLEESVKLIKETDLSASEIAYKVGFSSPSYFNKCFLDEFKITPGDYKKKLAEESAEEISIKQTSQNSKTKILISIAFLVIIVFASLYFLNSNKSDVLSTHVSSIAILPFLDLSENKDKEYLSDGITEALTRELSKIKELRVPSRTSSMRYKGEKRLTTEIAKDLDVNLVLEGSVLHEDDSILITVQLIKVFPEEEHLWAESYARKYENTLQLVNQISAEITKHISSVLEPQAKNSKIFKVDPHAYDLYLKGRHLYNSQKTRYNSLLKAKDYLDEAIELAPDFALAYIALAETYMAINFLILDNEEKFINRDNARRAIDKAMMLDNSLAEAYISKANLTGKFDWDWETMKELAEKGLELEPNNANAHVTLSNYYVVKGKYQKAIEEAIKAESLDPINPSIGCLLAERYYIAQEYELSINQYKQIIELNPNYGFAYNGIGFVYLQAGKPDKAVNAWQTLQTIMGNEALRKCYDEHFYTECFKFYLEKAKNMEPRFCSNPVIISSIHMQIDEENEAMKYLNIARKYKNEDLPTMLAYPDFYSLRNRTDFKELTQKIGVSIPN